MKTPHKEMKIRRKEMKIQSLAFSNGYDGIWRPARH